jgi:hypothetical protein
MGPVLLRRAMRITATRQRRAAALTAANNSTSAAPVAGSFAVNLLGLRSNPRIPDALYEANVSSIILKPGELCEQITVYGLGETETECR